MCPKILIFFLLIIMASSCKNTVNKPSIKDGGQVEIPEKQKLLRHIVLFKFKESATLEEIAIVVKAFKDLPLKIETIRGFEWGLNNSPENINKGFTHCFLLTFHSEADRATYLPHPDHKAFGGILGPILEDVLVVDYWAE
jgi:hypothetical protein